MATGKGLVCCQQTAVLYTASGQNDHHRACSTLSAPKSRMTHQSHAPMPFVIAGHTFDAGQETIPFILIKPNKSFSQHGMELGFAL